MLKIIQGDLLKVDYDYIAHQCYATKGRNSAGLANAIFKKYPHANAYDGTQHQVGSIQVHKPVINMFTQYNPGHPLGKETSELRLEWFRKALVEIGNREEIKQVAFPYQIGCGLAGGYWLEYEVLLIKFANWTNQEIILVRLPE